MPSEPLDARSRRAGLQARIVGGRKRVERGEVGVGDAAVEIELRQNRFHVGIEILQAVEEIALQKADRFRTGGVVVADIGRDGPKRVVIRVGDAGVRVELDEGGIEKVDALLDLIGEIVEIKPVAL